MLKPFLAFGLTRRPIILSLLLVFIGGGLVAFSKLNIEAYPNPAPVILEMSFATGARRGEVPPMWGRHRGRSRDRPAILHKNIRKLSCDISYDRGVPNPYGENRSRSSAWIRRHRTSSS